MQHRSNTYPCCRLPKAKACHSNKLHSIQPVNDALGLIATISLQTFKNIYFDGFIISSKKSSSVI